jgi:4-amino-4-deoxy-L-arabinose transferase-like glycosyltransferase
MSPLSISAERRGAPPPQPRSPTPGSTPAGGTRRWIERLGPWLGLVALCLALYLPGLAALPPTDRDEARFAQASRQMAATGDLVRIQFQEEPRNKKPILIYWAQAASAALFDAAPIDGKPPILPYRLPSLLGAMTAVLLLYGIGRRLAGQQTAFLAASLLASALLTVVEAHIATTDAALLAASVASLGALALLYTGSARGPGIALLFWLGLALGILIKGPVVPLIAGLAIAALGIADRSLAWLGFLRWRWGVPLALLVVAPWMIAIFSATGGSFFSDAITHDLLPKLAGGQESHGAFPGTYLLLVMLCFFPASLLLVPALWRGWIERRARLERFCLAWLLPAWLLFELVPTKLPHYVLPLYPALALLAARAANALDGERDALPKRGWMIAGGVLWGIVALAIAALGIAVPYVLEQRIDPAGILASLVMLVGGSVALAGFLRATSGKAQAAVRPASRALMLGVGSAAVAFGLIFGTVLPGTVSLWPSRSAAALVAHWREPGAPVAVAGYSEPSLVFQLGTFTQLGDAAAAATLMGRHGKALALVAGDQKDAFRRAAAAIGVPVQEEGTIRGFNISRGRWTTLTLYRQR